MEVECQLSIQEKNSCLDQPEPSQMKEEQEEPCGHQEGEQLAQNQETEMKLEFESECEETSKVCDDPTADMKETDHESSLQNIIWIPVIILHEINVPQLHVCTEESISNLKEEESEPPQIKEEQKELYICEGEQLELKQENQDFMITDTKAEPSETKVLEVINHIRTSSHTENVEHSPTLENHSLTDMEEILIKCCVCGKTSSGFYRNQSQMEHQEPCMSGVTLGLCERCRTRLDQKDSGTVQVLREDSSLKKHVKKRGKTHSLTKKTKKKRQARRKNTCVICGKFLKTNSSLEKHMRIHTGEKPFTCDTCGRGFTLKNYLTNHVRSHTGEKPFICKICGQCYKQNNSLKQHMSIHTGEKLFACDKCDKCFTWRSSLIEHMRCHSNEKPFTCEFCGKSYKHPHKLRFHRTRHTGEKPFTC